MTGCKFISCKLLSHAVRYEQLCNSISHWIRGNRHYWMINICFQNSRPSIVRPHLTFHLIPHHLFFFLALSSHWITQVISLSGCCTPNLTSLHKMGPFWKWTWYAWHHAAVLISILWRLATALYRCALPSLQQGLCSTELEHSTLPSM